jgi:hypothetical protein
MRVMGLLLAACLCAGCESAVVGYARAQHPGCVVEQVADRGDLVRVRVACPGETPFEQNYRSR